MRQDAGVDGDAQRISQLCWMFFLKIIDDQDQQLEMMQDGYRSPIPQGSPVARLGRRPRGHHRRGAARFHQRRTLSRRSRNFRSRGRAGDRRRVVRDVFEDAYNYMKSGQLMRQVINKINEVDFNDLAERQHFGDIYEQILNDLQSAGNAGEYYTPRAVTAFMVESHRPQARRNPARSRLRHRRLPDLRDSPHARALCEAGPRTSEPMQAALRAVEKKQLPHMLCVTNMLLHGIEDPSFVRHDNTLARPYISYTQSDRVDIVLTNPPFGGREEDGIESNFPQALPDPRNGRPVPRPHRPPAETRRPRRRGAAGWLAVRRGRQDASQGTSDGGVQPPHHRPPAQQRLQALRQHRHQPAVLREGRADRRTSGSTSTACPKARRPTR